MDPEPLPEIFFWNIRFDMSYSANVLILTDLRAALIVSMIHPPIYHRYYFCIYKSNSLRRIVHSTFEIVAAVMLSLEIC